MFIISDEQKSTGAAPELAISVNLAFDFGLTGAS